MEFLKKTFGSSKSDPVTPVATPPAATPVATPVATSTLEKRKGVCGSVINLQQCAQGKVCCYESHDPRDMTPGQRARYEQNQAQQKNSENESHDARNTTTVQRPPVRKGSEKKTSHKKSKPVSKDHVEYVQLPGVFDLANKSYLDRVRKTKPVKITTVPDNSQYNLEISGAQEAVDAAIEDLRLLFLKPTHQQTNSAPQVNVVVTGQTQPGWPGPPQSNWPGQTQPGWPGQTQPGWPGQTQPGWPGQTQPGWTGQTQPWSQPPKQGLPPKGPRVRLPPAGWKRMAFFDKVKADRIKYTPAPGCIILNGPPDQSATAKRLRTFLKQLYLSLPASCEQHLKPFVDEKSVELVYFPPQPNEDDPEGKTWRATRRIRVFVRAAATKDKLYETLLLLLKDPAYKKDSMLRSELDRLEKDRALRTSTVKKPNKPNKPDEDEDEVDDHYDALEEKEMPGNQEDIDVSQLKLLKTVLGQGHFAKVQLGDYCGKQVAVKILLKKTDDSAVAEFDREVKTWKAIPAHENVAELLGVCHIEGSRCMVMSLYSDSLKDELDSLRKNQNLMQRSKLISLVYGIASAVNHLHSHNIVHRDLAARNILYASKKARDVPILADFGLSRLMNENQLYQKASNIPLPFRLMAPESLTRKEFTTKSDVWGFGLLVWEILTLGEEPFSNFPTYSCYAEECSKNASGVEKMIREMLSNDKIPQGCSELLEVVRSCLQIKPEDRPDIDTILLRLEEIRGSPSSLSKSPSSFTTSLGASPPLSQ